MVVTGVFCSVVVVDTLFRCWGVFLLFSRCENDVTRLWGCVRWSSCFPPTFLASFNDLRACPAALDTHSLGVLLPRSARSHPPISPSHPISFIISSTVSSLLNPVNMKPLSKTLYCQPVSTYQIPLCKTSHLSLLFFFFFSLTPFCVVPIVNFFFSCSVFLFFQGRCGLKVTSFLFYKHSSIYL